MKRKKLENWLIHMDLKEKVENFEKSIENLEFEKNEIGKILEKKNNMWKKKKKDLYYERKIIFLRDKLAVE